MKHFDTDRRAYILGLARMWRIFGLFNPVRDEKAKRTFLGAPINAEELNREHPLCFDAEDKDSDCFSIVILNRKVRA